ncbi:hypothetical protein V6N12_071673 [Hibiscus sabdariffa]|uniref:POX domain-containing protein n=1 Tax=Hibiscus sabdariffa TaxID=183260 RepID=A0ABR2FKG9_9ROSI
MDMSRFRPESHVAQQSLRDKLRVPQSEDFPNSLNPDLVHVRSVRNDHLLYPDVISSGIFHVSSSSNVLPTAQEHRQMLSEAQSDFSKFSASSKVSGDPHGCGNWKSTVGYLSGLVGRETNQDPRFLGEGELNTARASNICAATQYLKPSYGNPHFASPSFYQNASQDVVTAAFIGTQELDVASQEHQNVREANRCSRMDYSGNQANPLQFGDADAWMNRRELGFLASKSSVELRTAASDATTQGLSLSLSSNPTSKICGADATQFSEDQYGYDGFHSRPAGFKELQDSETLNLDSFCSTQKPSSTGKANGKSIQDAGATSSNYVHRQTTPLGPFTGYSTILKNSRFLKPAQDLFDEFCHFTNSKPLTVCDTSDGLSGYINALGSGDSPNAVDLEAGTSKGNNSGSSSSTFHSFNESCRPEYQQKKAKLVHMLEEVGNRFSFPIYQL